MLWKMLPERNRGALIEQDPHRGPKSGRLQAARGVFQHSFNLRFGHARKPFKELIYRRTVLDILEKSMHRHARTAEDPSAACDTWGLFNGLA